VPANLRTPKLLQNPISDHGEPLFPSRY
jgi:hypothetical protein